MHTHTPHSPSFKALLFIPLGFFNYFPFCNLQVMLSTTTVLCSLRTALWTYLSLRRILDLQTHLINDKEEQESWAWPAQTVKTQGQQKACHQHTSPTVSEAWCHVLSDMATTLPSTSFLWKSLLWKGKLPAWKFGGNENSLTCCNFK